MSTPRLGVNLDHVVSLREARHTEYPDFRQAIEIAELAGADGITIHLREDRRHIQDQDVYLAREVVRTTLNLEMAATEEMTKIACDVRPDFCCIVPEKREELTTEGGLNVLNYKDKLIALCSELTKTKIKVSLFIEPEIEMIDAALETGAQMIELHTGRYADSPDIMADEYKKLLKAAEYADKQGLIVNAGHGLSRDTVRAVASIPQIYELNIGHALVADAIVMGLFDAVQNMKQAMQRGVGQ